MQNNMPFGWPFVPFLPGTNHSPIIPPTIVDDSDVFINSSVLSQPGPPGPPGPAGANGVDGVSVVDANVTNPTGELILTLSNGEEIYAGDVIGPQGPPGPSGPTSSSATIGIHSDYRATTSDFYIGVNSDGPSIIHLPEDAENGFQLVIKAEMKPPMGNRKITIIDDAGYKIDGAASYVIQVSYESLWLIKRDSHWYII
jgi:hypothetical protein